MNSLIRGIGLALVLAIGGTVVPASAEPDCDPSSEHRVVVLAPHPQFWGLGSDEERDLVEKKIECVEGAVDTVYSVKGMPDGFNPATPKKAAYALRLLRELDKLGLKPDDAKAAMEFVATIGNEKKAASN